MEKQRLVSVRLYVHREHSDYLAKAVNWLGAAVKYGNTSPLQTRISVRLRTRADRFQEVLGTLISEKVPYDVHNDTTGSTGYARFNEQHQYRVGAHKKGHNTRDWTHQARLRKEWATMKLINMIE
jgi:hypothetical protein